MMKDGAEKYRTNLKDAFEFLKDVKDRFKDRKDKYDYFVKVFRDYKAKRINRVYLQEKLKEIFEGDRDLIVRLNIFMPKGYEINLPMKDEQPPSGMEEARKFLNKIKTRFQGAEGHVYKSFIDIIKMYSKKKKSFIMVFQEVSTLFEDHPDLLREFYRFLPETQYA